MDVNIKGFLTYKNGYNTYFAGLLRVLIQTFNAHHWCLVSIHFLSTFSSDLQNASVI